MNNPNNRRLTVFLAAAVLLFFSCATEIGAVKPAGPEIAALPPDEEIPLKPIPEEIMGSGFLEPNVMAKFLLASNTEGDEDYIRSLAKHYIAEAAAEGVNHDVAFAQMCLETGYLKFGGLVTQDMYNFCGLGAISAEQPGERFPDALTGVRAHVQHLKAYATDEPLKQELVDPRYRYVRLGSSPQISGLAGTWAADKLYADKINGILVRLYLFSSYSL